MKIGFRTDSSVEIGTGHLMRCINLASEFKKRGNEIVFICRGLPGNLNRLTKESFSLIEIQNDEVDLRNFQFDWLIIDHYGLDLDCEKQFRLAAKKLLVVEDMPNRHHFCDALLVQNEINLGSDRYRKRTNPDCVQLLGMKYAVLSEAFRRQRAKARRRSRIERLLVFFGGVDKTGETVKVIEALKRLPDLYSAVDIVIGEKNPSGSQIEASVTGLQKASLHIQTDRMAELMTSADLCLGAGGTSVFERFCLGLPSLVVSIADNQTAILNELAGAGLVTYLGRYNEVTVETWVRSISNLGQEPVDLLAQGMRGMECVDGLGASRVADFVERQSHVQ